MGTVTIDSQASQVTVDVTADRLWSDIVVHGAGNTYTLVAESRPAVDVTSRPSRLALPSRPKTYTLLATSSVARTIVSAPNQTSHIGMDGIAEVSMDQGQWPALYSYLETRLGAAITQATVQKVDARIFRGGIEGGDRVKHITPNVADVIFDAVQYAVPATDGYNLAVEMQTTPSELPGGSVYSVEVVVELTTGEMLTSRGRVFVRPNLSVPANTW